MEDEDINKQEYLLRIHKVTDYIHNNIDQPLPLQKMAGIACFSPFTSISVFYYSDWEKLPQIISNAPGLKKQHNY